MNLSPSSSKRLLQYGLGIGAAAAAGTLPTTTQADIVYTPGQLTSSPLYFDLDPAAGSTTTVSSSAFAAADFRLVDNSFLSSNGQKPIITSYGTNGTNALESATRGTYNDSYALRLGAGATIGGAAIFNTSSSNVYFNNTANNNYLKGQALGDWTPGTSGYLGLRLANNSASTAGPFYGWAFVTLNAAGSSEFTVNGFAYDTVAGEAIQAGAVPEPNSVLLLIAGAAGVTALRARRKAQAAVPAE